MLVKYIPFLILTLNIVVLLVYIAWLGQFFEERELEIKKKIKDLKDKIDDKNNSEKSKQMAKKKRDNLRKEMDKRVEPILKGKYRYIVFVIFDILLSLFFLYGQKIIFKIPNVIFFYSLVISFAFSIFYIFLSFKRKMGISDIGILTALVSHILFAFFSFCC